MYGLLFSPVTLVKSSKSVDHQETNDNSQLLPYNSMCNIYGYFTDRAYVMDLSSNEKKQDYLNSVTTRNEYYSQTPEKLLNVKQELALQRKTLFKDCDKDKFDELVNYFDLITRSVEAAKIRRHMSNGFCGEATAASIVNSLLHQLTGKYRVSIQQVIIRTTDNRINHSFVLYNSGTLVSGEINNTQLKDILSKAKPLKAGSPAICDEYQGYHGPAAKWFENFFNDKSNYYSEVQYGYMEVTSFSLPSLRNGFNDKQRTWVKDFLIKLLSKVNLCNAENDVTACLNNDYR
jgi:hypothetical protein